MTFDLSQIGIPPKKTESELFDPERKKHFTGAAESTFSSKIDTMAY